MLVPGTNVWNVTAAGEFHKVRSKHSSSSLICCVWQAVVSLVQLLLCPQTRTVSYSRPPPPPSDFKFLHLLDLLLHLISQKKKKKPSHEMTLIPPSSLHLAQLYPLFGAMEDVLPWVPLPYFVSLVSFSSGWM